MARQIISSKDIQEYSLSRDSGGTVSEPVTQSVRDGYFDRLFKYIPAELVAGYIFILGSVKQLTDAGEIKIINWTLFIVFTLLTPLYLWKVQKVLKIRQLIISTISFCVWVFALGGPFELTEWYNPVYGSVLLPVVTLVAAICEA